MNVSIRFKLIVICLLMGLLPASAVAVFVWRAANVMAETKAHDYEAIATDVADKIDRNLFERYGDVQAFGFNTVVQDRTNWYKRGETTPIVTAMNNYVNAYDVYYLTLLVDLDGRVIAVNTTDDAGKPKDTNFLYDVSFKDAAWFKDALAAKFYASKDGSFTGTVVEHLYVDEHAKRAYGDEGLALGFTAPVFDADGKPVAIWKNVTKFALVEAIFVDAYKHLKERNLTTAELTLLDEQGNVLIDYDPSTKGSDHVVRDMSVISKLNLAERGVEAAQELAKGKAGAITSTVHARKGIQQTAGYTPLQEALGFPGMKWSVLVRTACSEALADVNSLKTSIWISLVVATLVIASISYSVANLIAKPLRILTTAGEHIALGDLEQNITVHSRDEIGALAGSFRKIAEAQKSLTVAATRIAAGDMSVTVTERSEKDELSKAFQDLQKAIGGLTDETRHIVDAAHSGQLDKRGETDRFQGAYRDLVQGFNQTLDAVIEPITEAADVLNRVADRDLTARVQGQYQGDHAKIKNALNLALDNLEQALCQAATGAEQVTSAATQISKGSQSLAQGASEQASSLQEVSSSLEEMASMTKQNAENSNQGKLLAGEARSAADRGNDAMTRMAGAIDKIKSSSDATAKIVKTIDEIAFQTNLLALNAAVEAARAGEAGKGFAVVAEEVRNLAQRSAEAAKNTANMIEESVKNADGGVRITEEVAKALGEISEASHKVNDLVAEIAAASAEQSKGIEQINLAVNQLDKVTQQNAANSEESASAAEELNSQAQCLSDTVRQFELRQSTSDLAETTGNEGTIKRGSIAVAKVVNVDRATRRSRKAAESVNGESKSKAFLPLDEEDFKGF